MTLLANLSLSKRGKATWKVYSYFFVLCKGILGEILTVGLDWLSSTNN